MRPRKYYLICTPPRAGSWMLCSGLEQTGVAGRPSEFFGPTLAEECASNNHLLHLPDVRHTFERIFAVSTTPNGVFGTKLIPNMTPVFLYKAAEYKNVAFTSLREALAAVFPDLQYILLTREDKVAQAVSYYRAATTGAWQRPTDAPSMRAVPYDHFALQRSYQHVLACDRYWEEYFAHHHIEPLRLTYEALLADHAAATRSVLQYLDLPLDVPILPPKTKKLSDALSAQYAKEFVAHNGIPRPTAADTLNLWAPY